MPLKKILIADDHYMTRKGMELILKASYPQAEIVEAKNGKEVIAQYKTHKPDIILTDYSMPEMNGFDAAQTLLNENRHIRIIMVTLYDTLSVALNFIKIGGRGFLSKSSNPELITESIRMVDKGDYYFNSVNETEITKFLKVGYTKTLPKIKFTELELAIVVKLSCGKTSKEISDALNLSLRTIETYRYDLIKKTGVKNSNQLIGYVFKNGFMEMR